MGMLAAAGTAATVFVAVDVAALLLTQSDGNTMGFVAETIAFIWPIAFVVALAHALVVGLPLFLLLSWLGRVSWRSILAGGFAAGALPYAMLALPWSAQPAELVAAKVIEPFSWPRYTAIVLGLGCLGTIGGRAGWLAGIQFTRPTSPARRL
jgi:hypothetical protein